MFCENRIVIAFDFLIAPCIPQIGLHADRLHIVCKFPDMIPQTAVLKVDASAVVLFDLSLIHISRTPLHDHVRLKYKWSDSQVVIRFVILQILLAVVAYLIVA